MKSSTKFLLRNIFVSLFFLSSSAVFGVLFWNELNRTVDNIGGKVVGEVVGIRGNVQRRFNQHSQWSSLATEEKLYDLDSIRTTKHAAATIVLKTIDDSGTEVYDEIELGADTFIILELLGKTRNINFVGGNISASGASGLTLTSEDTVVNPGDGTVSLTRKEGEETSIKVTEGEVEVFVDGVKTSVGTKSVLKIDENSGKTSESLTPMTPLTPKPNALLLTYEAARQVDFTWELFADWNNPVLEVTPSLPFSGDLTRRVQAGDGVSMELEPGQWYWRLADGNSGTASSPNNFIVDTERRTSPLSPPPGMTIPYRGNSPTISLQWDRTWYADSYTVEIASSASFTNPQLVREVSDNLVLVENLPPGQWWWRVLPSYRRGILDKYAPPKSRNFFLERRDFYDRIKLIAPSDGMSISALDVGEGVGFRWHTQDEISSYRITIASDPYFSQIAAAADGPENWQTLLSEASPGTYYWRVEGKAADNFPVPASITRSFEIQPVTNVIELINPDPRRNQSLEPYTSYTFRWRSKVPVTSRFILQKVVGVDRSLVIESTTQEQSFTVPLPGEGTYIWQVQPLDSRGFAMAEGGGTGRFRIAERFNPPTLLSPSSGERIALTGPPLVLINWSPVPAADAYRVTLKDPGGTVIARNDRVIGFLEEFLLPDTARSGTYGIELTSIRDNPPVGESLTSQTAYYQFTIAEIRRYTAAIPFSPANNSRIAGLSALRDGVFLRWNQEPLLDRWTIELNNGRFTQIYQTTAPQLFLDNLEVGEYSWMIHSWDDSGQEAPVSQRSRFTVGDLPTPPPPVVIFPAAGEDIDMTGAKSLRFEWQDSRDTGYFDMELYNEGSRTPIFQKKGLKNSFYVLRDLRILNVGNFVLEITANTEYADIGAARNSRTTRVPFSLSVNIPDTPPQILNSELLYAE